MRTLVILASVLSVCRAYLGQPESEVDQLCEMDIQPGVFEKKLVPGGQYIHDTTIYQTAEECMRSCCDQALNVISPNQSEYWQQPHPYRTVRSLIELFQALSNCSQLYRSFPSLSNPLS